jgi:hypothetical protein
MLKRSWTEAGKKKYEFIGNKMVELTQSKKTIDLMEGSYVKSQEKSKWFDSIMRKCDKSKN